jgi:putative endonuclease
MWYLYIIEGKDGVLYTGITTDIDRRLNEHNGIDIENSNAKSKGAKFTKGRGPFELIYQMEFENRSLATKEEIRVKSLPKSEKLKLCGRS